MNKIDDYQKEIFDYLISNRIFIESLTDDEIVEYYKIFKKLHKYRIIENIKICFAIIMGRGL